MEYVANVKFQFNVFCNVADIIEGNGQIPEQHVPTLTNSQTA